MLKPLRVRRPFAVACSWTLDSGVGAAQGQASICGGPLLDARLRSWSRSGSGVLFHTAELSTNSLMDFVVFWNSDFHTVFHTAGYIDSSTIICFHLSMCFMNSKRRLVDI